MKKEIQSAVLNPQVAREIISKMRKAKTKRKFETRNPVFRDAQQDHKDLLKNWN